MRFDASKSVASAVFPAKTAAVNVMSTGSVDAFVIVTAKTAELPSSVSASAIKIDAESSSIMVTTPTPSSAAKPGSAIIAPSVGLLSSTRNVSGASMSWSSVIGMNTVCVVTPGAKVKTTSEIAVKSAVCAVSEPDIGNVEIVTVWFPSSGPAPNRVTVTSTPKPSPGTSVPSITVTSLTLNTP